MTTSPMSVVLSRVEGLRKVGGHFVALCPAHPDQSPSLSIDEADDGTVLLTCRAGCSFEDVIARSPFEVGDLFPSSTSANGHDERRQIVAEYSYVDEHGKELFQVVRFAPKTFRQRRRAPEDPKADRAGWVWNLSGTRRVLYRLVDVIEAVAAEVPVYVVEGEKDVAAIDAAGEVATTCPGGAGKWRSEFAEFFTDADVIVVADQDGPGIKHAADVEASLLPVARSVRVVRPAVGKDAYDHLSAGLSLDELVTLAVDEARPGGTEAQATTDVHSDEPRTEESGLEFFTARALAEEVDNAAPVGFLFRPVWPADAYGVAAAEHKAGKTWLGGDMAVSAASATPWLGVYPVERAGPVLVFLGEGGKRKMLRRLRAICTSRGLVFEDLPIVLCFRAPHLTSVLHIARIAEKVAELSPVLVIIDPLYLAARGAKAASLYDMGAHLENVQAVVQAGNAALCVVHHWNQTGTGKGAERMSGAGPAEWGRVLVSAKVEHRHTDEATMATAVTLGLAFVGDEIPDTELRIRRRVWADDPADLSSPLHYEVEQLEATGRGGDGGGMSPATRRVLAALRAVSVGLTVTEIGDALAADGTGIPLKRRTIQDALKKLEDTNLARNDVDGGRAYVWRAHTGDLEGENGL